MKMRHITALLAALLLPALAQADDNTITSQRFAVQVQVDTQGHLQSVQPMRQLPAKIDDLLQRTLATWTFNPAHIGNQPVATTTWLYVMLKMQPRSDGQYDVHVTYLSNGPYIGDQRYAPGYPSSMLRREVSAKLVLLGTIEPDGHIDHLHLEQALTTHGRPAHAFADSAIHAIEHWKARPIVMDGVPRASQVRIPISYEYGIRQSDRDPPGLQPASDAPLPTQEGLPDGVVAAVDSPVSPRSLPGG